MEPVALMLAEGGPMKMFIVQLLAFIILVAVLAKLAIPAFGKVLGARSKEIEDTFKKIETDTEATRTQLAEYKEKLARIEQESRRRLEAAAADSKRTRDQLIAESQTQVQAAVEKAKREIAIERDKATLEMQELSSRLLLEASEHLAKTAMTDEIHNKLVDGYIAKIDQVKQT